MPIYGWFSFVVLALWLIVTVVGQYMDNQMLMLMCFGGGLLTPGVIGIFFNQLHMRIVI